MSQGAEGSYPGGTFQLLSPIIVETSTCDITRNKCLVHVSIARSADFSKMRPARKGKMSTSTRLEEHARLGEEVKVTQDT